MSIQAARYAPHFWTTYVRRWISKWRLLLKGTQNYEYALALSYNAFDRDLRSRIGVMQMAISATVNGQRGTPEYWQGCWSVRDGDCVGRPDQVQLVPVLHNLVKARLLPRNFAVVGVAFDDFRSRDQFRDQVTGFLHSDHRDEAWEWFTAWFQTYQRGEFANPANLRSNLATARRRRSGARHQANLSVLPGHGARVFCHHRSAIGHGGLANQKDGCWRRVVIEKPFGHDLDSAKALAAVKAVLVQYD